MGGLENARHGPRPAQHAAIIDSSRVFERERTVNSLKQNCSMDNRPSIALESNA
jgi:hypothetical protein